LAASQEGLSSMEFVLVIILNCTYTNVTQHVDVRKLAGRNGNSEINNTDWTLNYVV
jgi:hypothetical protein